MALSDEELLNFDEEELLDFDREKAERDLKQYGDAYRFQLVAARHMEQWAERLPTQSPGLDENFVKGYVEALREIAAHVRMGAYLPGRGETSYDETVGT